MRVIVGFRHVSTALSSGGDFRFEFKDLQEAMPTNFSYADQQTQCYLTPGDRLVLRLDFKDFDKTLTYSGPGSVVNNYLAQSLYKFAYGPASSLLRVGDWPKGTPTAAHRAADALRQARREYLAAYAKTHPLPAAFVHEQRVVIDSDWVTQQLGYAHQHDNEAMPAGYFTFMAEAPAQELNRLCKRSFIENSLLANMIYGYGVRLAPQGQLSTDPAEGPKIYQVATQELGAGRTRDWALDMLLSRNLRGNLLGAQAFYRTFRLHNQDSTLARSLRKSFANQARVKQGQPAPNFTLADNIGKQVSLSDFRGKVVYLDFWGTWCGPCIRQMSEFALVLKKQFEGRDVMFLYVSVGDAKAKWRQTITDKHFTRPNSVHLRSPDNVLADVYQVNGYPSYYLIGRDGRMVQPYVPYPSAGPKTVAAIEQALQQ